MTVTVGTRRDSLLTTVGIVVFATVVQWFRTNDTYFVYDDFLFMRIAQENNFGLDLLRRPIFEHFSPLLWTIDKAMVGPLHAHHAIARLIGLTIMAVAVAALHRLLLRVSGSPWFAGVAAMMFGASLFETTILRWWTTSIHAQLCAALTLLCLLFFVRRRQSGGRLDTAISVLAHIGAVLSHEKSLLIIGYLALLWALALSPTLTLTAARTEVRRHWLSWGLHSAVAVGASLNFFLGGYYLSLPKPPLSDLIVFMGRSVFVSFVPAAFFVRFPTVGGWLGPLVWMSVVVSFAAALTLTLRRNRNAWKGWAFLLCTFGVNLTVLGTARLTTFGKGIHSALQWQMELAFLFPLSLAIITATLRATRLTDDPPAGPPVARWWSTHRRERRGLLAVAALAMIAVSFRSVEAVQGEFDTGAISEAYFDTLQHDAERLSNGDAAPTVLDRPVPGIILNPVFAPYHMLSRIAPVLRMPIGFGTHAEGEATYLVRSTGHMEQYVLDSGTSLLEAPVCPTADDGAVTFDATAADVPTPTDARAVVLRLAVRTSGLVAVMAFSEDGSLLAQQSSIVDSGVFDLSLQPNTAGEMALGQVVLAVAFSDPNGEFCIDTAEIATTRSP